MADAHAAASEAPVLSIEDLRVEFDTDDGVLTALDGVNLTLKPGRTLGVVGESGCGKSVTARAALRIEDRNSRIASGRILLRRDHGVEDLALLARAGRAMREIRGREIGLVFQEPMTSFSPVHTIGDQIIETVELHFQCSRHEARERALAQLRAVGTPHPEFILSQYAWELSGGLRQRAMIAMALVCGPRLLIADEPTTALDVTTQAQVLDLLRSLQRQNQMALMLITHDLGVIAEAADDVAVMYLGRVVEHGPVAEIFAAPAHPYTRALMNSIPSLVTPKRTRLATLEGSVPHPMARPHGCPFHTRCRAIIDPVCRTTAPRSLTLSAAHRVDCHLYDSSHTGESA
ncbi:ABC transporter ATP-binding protein [Terricaulis sp.]|uniref:ABC transporter ATP-binding protein n=1 Tax=Terricaulis sp. TaxID=2768686 RepID=UPI003783BBCB